MRDRHSLSDFVPHRSELAPFRGAPGSLQSAGPPDRAAACASSWRPSIDEARDAAALADHAHALKSSSRSVGAVAVTVACERLEHLGRGGTTDGAVELLGALDAALAKAIPALHDASAAQPVQASA